MTSARHYAAEALGTAALLCAVVGSGIMAERLSGGNTAVALLANTLATVFALYVLIETLGPVSGAHFNPLVTLAAAWQGALPARQVLPFIASQLAGAVAGTWLAHAMFGLPLLQLSSRQLCPWPLRKRRQDRLPPPDPGPRSEAWLQPRRPRRPPPGRRLPPRP